ncbi:unnamed protein product [Coccothraustes coccothraustes]
MRPGRAGPGAGGDSGGELRAGVPGGHGVLPARGRQDNIVPPSKVLRVNSPLISIQRVPEMPDVRLCPCVSPPLFASRSRFRGESVAA